jgi:hypothetical protein
LSKFFQGIFARLRHREIEPGQRVGVAIVDQSRCENGGSFQRENQQLNRQSEWPLWKKLRMIGTGRERTFGLDSNPQRTSLYSRIQRDTALSERR